MSFYFFVNLSIMASTIYLLANPSPYGLDALLIFSYLFLSINNSLVNLYIVSSSVPTNLKVPAGGSND